MDNSANHLIKRILLGITAAIIMLPSSAVASRTSIDWVNLSGTSYIQPNFPNGMDLLIFGSSHYINFNTVTGASGYGVRDNAGVMEFKNSGGSWAGIGSGGSSSSIWPFTPSTNFGTSVQATTTPEWFQNGLYASSTSWIAYASTTALSATTLCLTGDICRTTWPTGGAGSTGLATSSPVSAGNLLEYSATGAGSAFGIATSTLTPSSPLTGSFTQIGSGGSLGCQSATGSQAGCLTSADWTTFNGKQATLIFNAPLLETGTTVSWTGLATTSQPASSNLLVSNGAAGVYGAATSSLSGGGPITVSNSPAILGGSTATLGCTNASNGVTGCMSANDWGLLHTATTTFSGPLSYTASTNAVTCPTCLTGNQTITLLGDVTGSGATSITTTLASTSIGSNYITGQLGTINTSAPLGGGGAFSRGSTLTLTCATCNTSNATVSSIATTFPILGGTITTTGTISSAFSTTSDTGMARNAVVLVGASGSFYDVASSSLNLPNTALQNSTISGVALGGTLNSLSNDGATLSGTSYNGSATVSNWAINLTHPNSWTGLQQFTNATSTLLSATTAWVGTLNLTNPLTVANGGTGLSTIGASSTVAVSNGAALKWQQLDLAATVYGKLPIANGGTNSSSFGTTDGILAYNGTSLVNFAGFTLTSTLLTAKNASTTAISVNGNEMSGQRYPVWGYATSTAWAGTTTVNLMSPFGNGTLSSIQCSTATTTTDTSVDTLNVQIVIQGTNVSPMFNASTTKGTVTFASGNTFTKGNILQAQFGTPVSSPSTITCTGIATGY